MCVVTSCVVCSYRKSKFFVQKRGNNKRKKKLEDLNENETINSSGVYTKYVYISKYQNYRANKLLELPYIYLLTYRQIYR